MPSFFSATRHRATRCRRPGAHPAGSLIALALLGGCHLLPPSAPEPTADAFVLPDVTVVEPGRRRTAGVDLVVRNGALHAPSAEDGSLPRLEEYRGATVLPGFNDLHTHLPPDTVLDLTHYFGLLYLAHGVTAVREAGDLDATGVPAAKAAFDAGDPMPTIYACGPFVGGSTKRWANWRELETAEQSDAVARHLADEGRSCIKVYDGLDAPRVRALTKAAQDAGLVAIGHVPYGMTLEEVPGLEVQHLMGVVRADQVAAGDHVVHRIMDWRQVQSDRIAEAVRLSVALDISHTPTLGLTKQTLHYGTYDDSLRAPELRWAPPFYREVVWHPQEGLALYRGLTPEDFEMLRDAWPKKLALVRGLHDAGVPLYIGTDTQQPWVIPGAAVWNEMGHFVEAGIPAEDVLAYATWKAGTGLGLPRSDSDFGSLHAGAAADFLVFRDDPTNGVTNATDLAKRLETLDAVVVRGRLYPRAELLEAVEAWRRWYEHPLIDGVAQQVARSKMDGAVVGSR